MPDPFGKRFQGTERILYLLGHLLTTIYETKKSFQRFLILYEFVPGIFLQCTQKINLFEVNQIVSGNDIGNSAEIIYQYR